MGHVITRPGWHFGDGTKTTAEVVLGLYGAILRAAGDSLVLGCNCMGHLGGGLMHLNRTGDDTSGVPWERTRQRGSEHTGLHSASARQFLCHRRRLRRHHRKNRLGTEPPLAAAPFRKRYAPLRLDTSWRAFSGTGRRNARRLFEGLPRGIPRCSSGLAGYHLSPPLGSFRQRRDFRLDAGRRHCFPGALIIDLGCRTNPFSLFFRE